MSLTVVPGKLDLLPSSIVCQLSDGETVIICTIAHQVLLDLGAHHGLRLPVVAIFSELLSDVERLASAKFYAGRPDDHGDLSIGTADLLRHGFCRPSEVDNVAADVRVEATFRHRSAA